MEGGTAVVTTPDTVICRTLDLEPRDSASALYTAEMKRAPCGRAEVSQTAARRTGTASHPVIAVPLSRKVTLPPPSRAFTEATNLTTCPRDTGLGPVAPAGGGPLATKVKVTLVGAPAG